MEDAMNKKIKNERRIGRMTNEELSDVSESSRSTMNDVSRHTIKPITIDIATQTEEFK